jgi:hypothetical protein
MQTITILCPDEFTPEQLSFIKGSAFNQIQAEIESAELVVAEEVKAKVAKKVKDVKDAMFLSTAIVLMLLACLVSGCRIVVTQNGFSDRAETRVAQTKETPFDIGRGAAVPIMPGSQATVTTEIAGDAE